MSSASLQTFGNPAKAWFPGGVEDPDLALVAVLVADAEYWDVKANKAVQINMLDEGFDGAWYWDLEQRAGCSQAAWWAI